MSPCRVEGHGEETLEKFVLLPANENLISLDWSILDLYDSLPQRSSMEAAIFLAVHIKRWILIQVETEVVNPTMKKRTEQRGTYLRGPNKARVCTYLQKEQGTKGKTVDRVRYGVRPCWEAVCIA